MKQYTYDEMLKELNVASMYPIDGVVTSQGTLLCPECFKKLKETSKDYFMPAIQGITYDVEDEDIIYCDECTMIVMSGL